MWVKMEHLGINKFSRTPDYVALHNHSSYEMLYFPSGEGSLHCGDSLMAYAPGTVIIVPPGVAHDEIHSTPSDVVFLLFTLEDPGIIPQPLCFSDMQQQLEQMIGILRTEWMLDLSWHQEKLDATLALILVELFRAHSAHRIGSISGYFTVTRSQGSNVREDFLEEQELASLGYSRDRYRHLFKERTGVAPHQFIIQARLEKAKHLLRFTTLPITEIATHCGYSSSSYFAMQFKKHIGITPTNYRMDK